MNATPEAGVAAPARPGAAASGEVPLSLYVHVPWCVRKCPYCDFNSHHLRGELPAAAYVDALLADLDADLEADLDASGAPVTPLVSIFIGGGTPSLLPAAQLGRLLDGIAARLRFAADIEITLEANPGTVERCAFGDVRATGVNRLSLGIQSFDDANLAALGRIHDGRQAEAAAREACAVFDRVNLDIMYALPGQDLGGCLADLERALALHPGHLSHYELTIEPATVFARYPPSRLPDHDLACDMREASEALLAGAGYLPYEVSAYAAGNARRARHNLNYWTYGDYFGIGAGAHGKRTLRGGVVRTVKLRSPQGYLAALAARRGGHVLRREAVPALDLPAEFMLNALRLTGGFSDTLLRQRLGAAAEDARRILSELAREGLMARAGGVWRPTARGRRFVNDMQARFLQ